MPVFKTRITINNLADTIRSGIDLLQGEKNKQSIALLESFNLLDGDKIKVSQSKYTNFFINKLSILPHKGSSISMIFMMKLLVISWTSNFQSVMLCCPLYLSHWYIPEMPLLH